MRLHDIKPGLRVLVRRGYSVRPAITQNTLADGRVGVSFTDVTPEILAALPPTRRSYLFGAFVRPNQITPAPAENTL